jgi:hypothetical protein
MEVTGGRRKLHTETINGTEGWRKLYAEIIVMEVTGGWQKLHVEIIMEVT